MPRSIHGDDDQIVPVDTSASGGWPLAAWDGGGAVGGQPWHCPLAANLDSTANLEGDILERDEGTGVLGHVPDFDRCRPGRGLALSPVAVPPAKADHFERSVLAAHDAAFPGARPRIEPLPVLPSPGTGTRGGCPQSG